MIYSNDYFILPLFICEGLICFSILGVIILTCLGASSLHYALDVVDGIGLNWNTFPIVEMVDTLGDCPSGFTPLIQETWKGIIEGCECTNTLTIEQSCYSTEESNIDFYCNPIASYPQMNLFKWKGTKICVKRGDTSYQTLFKKLNNSTYTNTCPAGLKQCGVLDTYGNLLCQDQNSVCPINKLIVQSKTLPPPKDFTYKQIILTNSSEIIYYTNGAIDQNILVDIKISEGPVCIYPNETSLLSTYNLEIDGLGCQSSVNWKSNEIKYDNRYTSIDIESKLDLYSQNGVYSILKTLPQYDYLKLKNSTISLNYRPYIGWKQACVGGEATDPNIVFTISDKISSMKSLKIVNAVFSFVLAAAYLIAFLFKYRKLDGPCPHNFAEFVFMIISSVLLIIGIYLIAAYSTFDDDLSNFNCGDSITNFVFSVVGTNIQNNLIYDKIVTYLSIFNTSAYVLMIFLQLLMNLLFRNPNL